MLSKERKRCTYPMSLFYIYEDEVPRGVRVSTSEDCEDCEDMKDCEDSKHCLITEITTPHPIPDE